MLDPEKNPALKKEQIKRDLCGRLEFRGDVHDIQTIYEAGGFHPSYALGEAKYKYAKSQHPFDIIDHRSSSDGSGFISTSDHVRLAYVFGCMALSGTGLEEIVVSQKKFTVYAVKAEGAMSPAKDKQEYSVPGGIDKEKILGYRDCELIRVSDGNRKYTKSYYIKSENVFFRKDVKLRREIIESFLFKDESIATQQGFIGLQYVACFKKACGCT